MRRTFNKVRESLILAGETRVSDSTSSYFESLPCLSPPPLIRVPIFLFPLLLSPETFSNEIGNLRSVQYTCALSHTQLTKHYARSRSNGGGPPQFPREAKVYLCTYVTPGFWGFPNPPSIADLCFHRSHLFPGIVGWLSD